MKRMVVVVFVVLTFAACGTQQDSRGSQHKSTFRDNDTTLPQSCYHDYFVNDSDGTKDPVFTVYDESCGIKVNGVSCAIVKSFDSEGVGLQMNCPQLGTK